MENNVLTMIPPDADKLIEDYHPLIDADSVPITPYLNVNIPTVREVMYNDMYYFSITTALTSNPRAYAVQLLDEMNIDFSQITEYDLFIIYFSRYVAVLQQAERQEVSNPTVEQIRSAMSLIFKDTDLINYNLFDIPELGGKALYNPVSNVLINEFVYKKLADVIRKLNLYEHDKGKCGNEAYKNYELEKQRRRLKRNKRKKYNHFFEQQVIALVNNAEFKYNYEETLDLSIYNFYQSLRQVPKLMSYYNIMHGVYGGTVDTSKINDRSVLSWLSIEDN